MQDIDNINKVYTTKSVIVQAKYLMDNRWDIFGRKMQNLEVACGGWNEEQYGQLAGQFKLLGIIDDNDKPLKLSHLYTNEAGRCNDLVVSCDEYNIIKVEVITRSNKRIFYATKQLEFLDKPNKNEDVFPVKNMEVYENKPATAGDYGSHIQPIKVSANLDRKELFELARNGRGPYHRYVSFPDLSISPEAMKDIQNWDKELDEVKPDVIVEEPAKPIKFKEFL